ncbi:MAG: CPBP family glutamic-type intramembrane protease [Methanobacteriaceae archaeon]|nr:CPBP family glutamic-type intramembrane protease [Methanobacteriaceae archaeon]
MKTNWKLFIILLILSAIGTVFVTPYTLTLQGGMPTDLPIPIHILLTVQIIQNIVLFAILIGLGLFISKKIGFGLPILEGWLEKKGVKQRFKSLLGISIGLGILAGVLIIIFDIIFSLAGVTISLASATQTNPPAWQGFLASFYGGINEEIMMRLFLMSLFVWIFYKIKKTSDGKPTTIGVWLAIFITAVLFGLGHLPITSALTALTPLVILRAIILNGIGGIIFGWLYWKKGLESAMISHFSADIVLHVILPLIILI